MFSLKPKEGGSGNVMPPPPQQAPWMKIALVVCLVAIAAVGYSGYSGKQELSDRIVVLEAEHQKKLAQLEKQATDISADVNVMTKRLGVTTQELDASRKYAERLKQEQDKAREQLARELAAKANSTDVAAFRQEAATKLNEFQQDASNKIGNVSGEVKTVATNLESTREELAASRRDLVDVRTTLSQQIARNSGELADLRKKGERDFFEFDIKKDRKTPFQRVADIQLQLTGTDPKRQRYDVLIQVDDNRLSKKDRTANEPVQFLVGRDKLRYEVVVNTVDKDRIRGYLSTPKDKVLSAERPALKDQ